uniref:Uncharacterized protein n=1 Tax=Cacopsylla melanoneura TaxID=428564 RepID=A0A8D8QWL3_9HEMI
MFAVRTFELKHLDLAGGRVKVSRRGILNKRVYLNTKWDSLLTTMLLSCELCTDAIHLDINPYILARIPMKLNGVEACVILNQLTNTVAERQVHLKDAVTRSCRTPQAHLLPLRVLQASVMK